MSAHASGGTRPRARAEKGGADVSSSSPMAPSSLMSSFRASRPFAALNAFSQALSSPLRTERSAIHRQRARGTRAARSTFGDQFNNERRARSSSPPIPSEAAPHVGHTREENSANSSVYCRQPSLLSGLSVSSDERRTQVRAGVIFRSELLLDRDLNAPAHRVEQGEEEGSLDPSPGLVLLCEIETRAVV